MRIRFGLAFAVAVAVTCAGVTAYAQDERTKVELPPNLRIAELLAGPDRRDFKCDMELEAPRLTFQQRNLVEIRADVDPSPEERKAALELYFVVKIADAAGKWLPDDSVKHISVPAGFDKNSEIEFSAGFYAKPGTYTFALVVFDASSGKTDLIRKPFEVKAPKNDRLPQLERDLRAIDFVSNPPTEQPVSTGDHFSRRIRLPDFETAHVADQWPPGHGSAYLPVHNKRPLLVDLVLNIAPPTDSGWRSTTSQSRFRAVAGTIMQAGAVLSDLGIENGCVEVSAIDLAQLQVVFERMPARDADWDKLAKQVEKRNNATISVAALGDKSATGNFLEKYMEKIGKAGSDCASGSGGADHVVMFVSKNFDFPSGTRGAHLDPDPGQTVRYYLIRISRTGGGDDLVHFFKPVDPRRFDVSSPEEFRGFLANLISELSETSPPRK